VSILSDGLARYLEHDHLERMAAARVGIAGAGGLGSNCAAMLVRSGLRRLVVADRDVVEPSNLNRQQYQPFHLGKSKVDALAESLRILEPRLVEARRLLTPNGSMYFHIDYREVHYCKVLLDGIFGRESFLNEIIWAYDYGARTRKKWPPKHDNILWYAKNPADYIYNIDDIDRIPYMAPGLEWTRTMRISRPSGFCVG